jgi:hypothetical protein
VWQEKQWSLEKELLLECLWEQVLLVLEWQ